jgi:hypothetical protein
MSNSTITVVIDDAAFTEPIPATWPVLQETETLTIDKSNPPKKPTFSGKDNLIMTLMTLVYGSAFGAWLFQVSTVNEYQFNSPTEEQMLTVILAGAIAAFLIQWSFHSFRLTGRYFFNRSFAAMARLFCGAIALIFGSGVEAIAVTSYVHAITFSSAFSSSFLSGCS